MIGLILITFVFSQKNTTFLIAYNFSMDRNHWAPSHLLDDFKF